MKISRKIIKIFFAPTVATILIMASIGIASGQNMASPTEDEVAIRNARILQTRALAANDLDTVVSYWTPDITIRRALGQAVTGAEAARLILLPPANPAAQIIFQRESTSIEASPNWPLAYEEGRWTGHMGSISAPAILSGRYSAQWVKRDGKWLIRSEVFVALTCTGVGCTFPALP